MREVLKLRAKQIGLEVIKLMDDLPNKPSVWVLTKQIIRSSTSIGANYRAAFRAKSDADFVYKLKIVEEETDETIYLVGGIGGKQTSRQSKNPTTQTRM